MKHYIHHEQVGKGQYSFVIEPSLEGRQAVDMGRLLLREFPDESGSASSVAAANIGDVTKIDLRVDSLAYSSQAVAQRLAAILLADSLTRGVTPSAAPVY